MPRHDTDMSLLGPKPFMAQRGDVFAALRLKRERDQRGLPICHERWISQGKTDGGEIHKCARVHGHLAEHVCACGARRHRNAKKGKLP